MGPGTGGTESAARETSISEPDVTFVLADGRTGVPKFASERLEPLDQLDVLESLADRLEFFQARFSETL